MRLCKQNYLTYGILFLFLGCFQIATANAYESMSKIRDVAKKFVLSREQLEPGESIEVQVNPSNTTFEVAACNSDIVASYPKDANRELSTSIELTCNDSQPWHILVPVDVQVFTKVLMTKRSIPPKQIITEEDIDYTLYNKNRLYNGYFTKKEDVVGNETAFLVTAGTILTKKNVEMPIIIHRNQVVSISAQSNAVVVTMQGVAKSDGALNSVIQIYNPSSKRTLDAVVVGPNKAQVIS